MVREIGDEEFATGECFLELFVRFLLIIFAVQIKHARIAEPQIGDPAKSDVSLHEPGLRLTYFAQIAITGNDDPFFRRQWIVPWRLARDRANALMKLALIQGRRFRIEPRELVKLLDRPGHDKT